MKKYLTLGEFLVDFREHRNLTQIDFAALLDVDVRTIIRWERNESLIKTEKEMVITENFGIPRQVIRNLNSDRPISVNFDFKRWMYSLTLLSSIVKSSKEFKTEHELVTSRIGPLKDEKDFEFINYIQKNQKNCMPLRKEVIETAARILPEINLVVKDDSGFHDGHVSILPLKYEAYEAIRDKKMRENEIRIQHLSQYMDDDPKVFYFYSIYSNSSDNTYYLINKLLFYFKKLQETNYIFAGITFQELKIERFKEMGFHVIWQQEVKDHPEWVSTFLSGNFNDFLFNENQF